MSEREEHFNLGSGWPPWKDEPIDKRERLRLAVRLALFIAVAALVGANLWFRSPASRVADFPDPSGWRPQSGPLEYVSTPFILSAPEARRIAVDEVKRREGWTGTGGEVSQVEGYQYSVHVQGEAGTERDVEIEGRTRKILRYSVLHE